MVVLLLRNWTQLLKCKVLTSYEVDALKNAKTVLFWGPTLPWSGLEPHTPGGTKLRCVRADKTNEAEVLVVGHKDTLEVCEEQLSNTETRIAAVGN